MDEEHIKYIFATGFQKFWRGKGQKERLYEAVCSHFLNSANIWELEKGFSEEEYSTATTK